jgi:hypothetical protein
MLAKVRKAESKTNKKKKKTCKNRIKVVYLQCHNECYGYPGDIPAWGKPTPTLPNFKRVVSSTTLLFCVFLHEYPIKHITLRQLSGNRYGLMVFEYQHLYSIAVPFKVFSDVTSKISHTPVVNMSKER